MKHESSLRFETRNLLIVALPLAAAYLAEFAMFNTTKMVVAELGYHELAAVGIASNLAFEVVVILMGLLSVVGVFCAQAEGGGRKKEVGLVVRQGFIVSVILGVPAVALIWNLDWVFKWTHQDPLVTELSKPYLKYVSSSILAVLFFAVLRSFVASVAKPGIVMVISVVAVFVNYIFTKWFVFGGFGVPAMGLGGAGLAMNLVSWLMFFALLLYVYVTSSLRGYGIFAERWKFDWVICREIIWLGTPVAGLVFIEASLFAASSLLSGVISAETLAAFQVVMAWVGLPFVIAEGIAEATMVRVAHGIGRGSVTAARLSGNIGMGLGVFLLVLMTVVPIFYADVIINLFVSSTDEGAEMVTILAAEFLVIVAIFQVFDGLQVIAARALRGVKDSVAPLWIASFGYWVLGMGGGALLAFKFDMQGAGIWWGLAIGLMATGSMLAWRFRYLTGKMLRQEEVMP